MKFEGPHDLPAIIHEAHYLSPAVQEAQKKAELKNAALRRAERMAQYAAWVRPEAIAERKERHEREAAESLSLLKEILGPRDEEPLPDEKDLPAYMRGQSPSTIRKMLKHQTEMRHGIQLNIDAVSTVPIVTSRRPWYRRVLAWLKR